MKDIAIRVLRRKLKVAQKEKDGIQLTIGKLKNPSKSLNKLIDCQIVDNSKKGLGYENYNAVLPSYIGNFMPSKPKLSFTSLNEFANKHVDENVKAKSSKEESKATMKKCLEDMLLLGTPKEEKSKGYVKKSVFLVFGLTFCRKSKEKCITYYCWVNVNVVEEQFWSTVVAKTINGKAQIHARVDGKKIIISEASIRRDLQFAEEEGVDFLPNSTIFEQLASMGKPTRKVTKVPQPSDPIEHVANEAVHKELGDSLVRAATTASSLEAEQDGGDINRTQSKATPNESSSQETNSGGGPRCQKAMGDTIAQTRFESASKHSNDSLLAREKTMTTQANEIDSLKRRVKKLKRKSKSRTHKLKRLYKERKIDDIDDDEDITLVSVPNDADKEMFDADKDLGGEEIKGVVIQESSESTTTTTTFFVKQKSQDKGKGIMVEELMKPKKKDQIRLDEEVALRLQAKFNKEERLTIERAQKELESNIALIKTWDDVQAKINVDHQLAKRLQEENNKREELVQESTKKQKVEDVKETTELKRFDREDLEDLYKLVKARYGSTRPLKELNFLLWVDLKTMFEPHVKDEAWKRQQGYKVLEWKLYESCEVHSLRMQSMHIYMLIEKKYLLTPSRITDMLNKKFQIDYQSKMAYQLLKLITKQLKKSMKCLEASSW
nr:hypothetical protein [Tanacetum cinerariifolium]